MKKTLYAIATLLAVMNGAVQAQVTIGSNNPPDPSAILDLQSQSQGLLLPRLTTAQRNAIANPAHGLHIYNTTTNCVQVFFPQGWQDIKCDCQSSPSSQFTYSPNSPAINGNVTFTPTTSGLVYSWTFQSGSPSTSTSQNPVVVWSSAGTYDVTLTVTDNNGCSSSTIVQVTVTNCLSGGSQTFAYTGSLQSFTVPVGVCSITIEAWGAEGAESTGQSGGQQFLGGKGAHIVGTFAVNGGEQLDILVGQRGVNSNCGSGGGGGSFVVNVGSPWIIAGGGGGGFHCNALGGVVGVDGQSGNNATAGNCTPNRFPIAGGTNGNGGNAYYGGGGGGFLTAGQSSTGGGGGVYPGNGGNIGGGYGGGGGYYVSCCGGSGGGGGYSGGSGPQSDGCSGGGGGSYNAGLNQTNTAGVRAGDGQVIITW